jgi:N-methylhydantoinase A
LVTLRVSASIPGTEVELGADPLDSESNGTGTGEHAERPTRTATLNGERIQLHVIGGAPSPGTTISGPAVVELPESTLLVPPGWSGEVDPTGTVHLRSERDGSG